MTAPTLHAYARADQEADAHAEMHGCEARCHEYRMLRARAVQLRREAMRLAPEIHNADAITLAEVVDVVWLGAQAVGGLLIVAALLVCVAGGVWHALRAVWPW